MNAQALPLQAQHGGIFGDLPYVLMLSRPPLSAYGRHNGAGRTVSYVHYQTLKRCDVWDMHPGDVLGSDDLPNCPVGVVCA